MNNVFFSVKSFLSQCTSLSFCYSLVSLKVMEGGMKDLNPAILNAVDLDAPPDLLRFTILVPPAHGTLLHGIYGLDMSQYKDMGPEILQRSIPVQSFTMQTLQQGQLLITNPPYLEFCLALGVEREVCQCSTPPQGWLPLWLPEGAGLFSLGSRLAEQMLQETEVIECLWCFCHICEGLSCTFTSAPLCTQ